MSTEDKVNELHSRLLDPDEGVIVQLKMLNYRFEALSDKHDEHAEDDEQRHEKIEKRLDSLEHDRAKVKGVIAGSALGGTALGAAVSKLLGLFSS